MLSWRNASRTSASSPGSPSASGPARDPTASRPASGPSWRTWLLAVRPVTLTAAVTPVLVGTAAAVHVGRFAALPFVAAVCAAMLIQIGTNLANDVFDFEKGADTTRRLGPPRVTQAGLVSARRVRAAMLASFGLAAAIGLYLVVVGGWPILAAGVLSIAAGMAYTGGPWPLGYHGLGDVLVFVFFGLVAVLGSYYLQVGGLSPMALAAAVIVGLPVTAILVVNNLRDLDTDRQAGKRTLAVCVGARATRVQYALLVLAPYPLAGVFISAGILPRACWLLWLPLPPTLHVARPVLEGVQGPRLNPVLRATARLHLFCGLLLAAGFVL